MRNLKYVIRSGPYIGTDEDELVFAFPFEQQEFLHVRFPSAFCDPRSIPSKYW